MEQSRWGCRLPIYRFVWNRLTQNLTVDVDHHLPDMFGQTHVHGCGWSRKIEYGLQVAAVWDLFTAGWLFWGVLLAVYVCAKKNSKSFHGLSPNKQSPPSHRSGGRANFVGALSHGFYHQHQFDFHGKHDDYHPCIWDSHPSVLLKLLPPSRNPAFGAKNFQPCPCLLDAAFFKYRPIMPHPSFSANRLILCTYVYTYIYIYMCVCKYMCIYILIYIYSII